MPRRREFFAALALALPSAALAQGSSAETATIEEILALREKVRAAAAAKNRSALEALYDPNFMHVRDTGRTDLKPERIELLLSGEPAIETAREEDVQVQVYGPATAVATGISAVKDAASGRAVPFRWLVLYVKGEAGWRVALSQANRVATPR
jgi:hypothetical protein